MEFNDSKACSRGLSVNIELSTSSNESHRHSPAVHVAMGCGQRSSKLVWRCHQLLSGFLAQDHFPRVSRQSRLSANDNELIPGAVHNSLGIYLIAEENPGKPQLGDRR